MKGNSLSPRARLALFAILIIVGLAYIAVFAWFKRNSVDFVERDRDAQAAAAAAAINPVDIDWTFEAGNPARAMLGLGWRAQDEATWSRRTGGVIFLPSSVAAGRTLRINFDGQLNPTEPGVTVTLDANGETIGQWVLTPENLQIDDKVRLPARNPHSAPWRLRFAIERPGNLFWRGYEPVLLINGIYLRNLRTEKTISDRSSDSQ